MQVESHVNKGSVLITTNIVEKGFQIERCQVQCCFLLARSFVLTHNTALSSRSLCHHHAHSTRTLLPDGNSFKEHVVLQVKDKPDPIVTNLYFKKKVSFSALPLSHTADHTTLCVALPFPSCCRSRRRASLCECSCSSLDPCPLQLAVGTGVTTQRTCQCSMLTSVLPQRLPLTRQPWQAQLRQASLQAQTQP